MLDKLTNFSIAVSSIDEAADYYAKMFGVKMMRVIPNPSHYGFQAAWMGDGETAFIELLEPTDPEGAVARFLKSRGGGVYMVSFDVPDLAEAVRHVRANGGRITGIPDDEEPGPNTNVVWVHPSTTMGVFVQLQRPGRGVLE
ncbi:MAG: VOC family protein [SAR202 cluster bacterium]|nr:VOC family protein [SAR202 cluster bacterium]